MNDYVDQENGLQDEPHQASGLLLSNGSGSQKNQLLQQPQRTSSKIDKSKDYLRDDMNSDN